MTLWNYRTPGSCVVAEFIGSPAMNILSGTVRSGTFYTKDGTAIPLNGAPGAIENQKVKLGIRPEDFVLEQAGLAGEIITVEPTGSETQVAMKLAGHDVIGVFRERIGEKPGEALHVRANPERLRLFDASTGKRLVN